jgi:hypothetical protein
VNLRATQTQIDNELTVALDVPNVASIEIAIPSVTKDGFKIRISGVNTDGSAIVEDIRIMSESLVVSP